jgi:DNA-binding NarL/FixJ family response regulator
VLLCERRTIFRQGLRALFAQEPRFRVIGETGSAQEALGLSEKTVRNRLSSIYDKLQLRNRTQAALRAAATLERWL